MRRKFVQVELELGDAAEKDHETSTAIKARTLKAIEEIMLETYQDLKQNLNAHDT